MRWWPAQWGSSSRLATLNLCRSMMAHWKVNIATLYPAVLPAVKQTHAAYMYVLDGSDGLRIKICSWCELLTSLVYLPCLQCVYRCGRFQCIQVSRYVFEVCMYLCLHPSEMHLLPLSRDDECLQMVMVHRLLRVCVAVPLSMTWQD